MIFECECCGKEENIKITDNTKLSVGLGINIVFKCMSCNQNVEISERILKLLKRGEMIE